MQSNKISSKLSRAASEARDIRRKEELSAKGQFKVEASVSFSPVVMGSYDSLEDAVEQFKSVVAGGQYKEVNVLNPAGNVVKSYYNNFYKG